MGLVWKVKTCVLEMPMKGEKVKMRALWILRELGEMGIGFLG